MSISHSIPACLTWAISFDYGFSMDSYDALENLGRLVRPIMLYPDIHHVLPPAEATIIGHG
jgi:hypothetical protein